MLSYYMVMLYFMQASLCQDLKPNFVVILTDDQDVVSGGMVSDMLK